MDDKAFHVIGGLVIPAINILIGLLNWYRGNGWGAFVFITLFYVAIFCIFAGLASFDAKLRKKRRARMRATLDQKSE